MPTLSAPHVHQAQEEFKSLAKYQPRESGSFFTVLRLYNPLQSFFDKTWRPSEVDPV
jgi:hypothetical protein